MDLHLMETRNLLHHKNKKQKLTQQFLLKQHISEIRTQKKFHYPDCRSVKQMSEHNKEYMGVELEEKLVKVEKSII